MLNQYLVIHAAPWWHDAVDMVSLCVYQDLYEADRKLEFLCQAWFQKTIQMLFFPVDCVLYSWSSWNRCSGCRRTRTRRIQTYPNYGGNQCGSLEQMENCNSASAWQSIIGQGCWHHAKGPSIEIMVETLENGFYRTNVCSQVGLDRVSAFGSNTFSHTYSHSVPAHTPTSDTTS